MYTGDPLRIQAVGAAADPDCHTAPSVHSCTSIQISNYKALRCSRKPRAVVRAVPRVPPNLDPALPTLTTPSAGEVPRPRAVQDLEVLYGVGRYARETTSLYPTLTPAVRRCSEDR